MIRLPVDPLPWALLRVVSAPSWNADSDTSDANWRIEPTASGTSAGYEVIDCERVALPQVGQARLRYRMGVIDGKLVGELSAGASPSAWNPATMTAMAPSLLGREIRIQQCADPTVAPSSRQWFTIFWGQVEYEEDDGWPGSTLPAGERIYHLTDALARARKWRITKHAYDSTVKLGGLGYNIEVAGAAVGNRGTSNVSVNGYNVREHALPGAGSKWTDEDVIEHALTISRPSRQPVWLVPSDQATAYLGQTAPAIRVDRDTDAWSVMSKCADWKQGRGVVYLDWTESASTDSTVQQMTTFLAVAPPFASDFSHDASRFGGSTFSWQGASSFGSMVSVDLIGDHRAIEVGLKLGDPDSYRVEYLESIGEPIETVVTLSVIDGTLAKRWTASDETAMAAATVEARASERWRPVGQKFGLPLTWTGTAADGNGGTVVAALIACGDDGTVSTASGVGVAALKIMPDLPILEGYVYTGATPAKADGSSTTAATETPDRRAALALVRDGSDAYTKIDDASVALTFKISGIDLWMYSKQNEENGTPYFADNAGLTPAAAPTAAVVTVAIASDALPLRMAQVAAGKTEDTATRRKTIRHPGLALWYAHSGAIYDLDSSTGKRNACRSGGGTGILRDDRLTLCARHILACRWYGLPTATGSGSEVTPAEAKRSASWQLRSAGLYGGFDQIAEDGEPAGETAYPAIGELVQYLYANGSKITLNTPITRVHYDHQEGVTTWTTDWQELDFQ